ncbi:MAG: decarboxylating NADP(+)-dependent phosphogluconate dehydrogenase [Spartobacteria bacterium]|nr:decarboxylating NADP(+)-dependent phosphogluconate dehydrogenase [Spartobacteria bacterium]
MSKKADIGLIGLAVMGENLALNIERNGFTVAVYNRTQSKVDRFMNSRGRGKQFVACKDLEAMTSSLSKPRKIMLMLKAGHPVDATIDVLTDLLEPGDIIIDGGNSLYSDTERRLNALATRQINYVGTGISGGEEGALNGPSIMPGGEEAAWPSLKPIFEAIAAKADDTTPCCTWIGSGGAGHFVKMVHNGIEYGDMQIICEGFQLLRDVLHMSCDDMSVCFQAWNNDLLDSYLTQITYEILAFKDDNNQPLIESILDKAGQKGTGKWTINAALDFGTPLTLISEAVFARLLSSMKTQRMHISSLYPAPAAPVIEHQDEVIAHIQSALYVAKICSYAQGFALLQAASKANDWQLDFAAIARIWRGGCIIRSSFLDDIATAYEQAESRTNIMLAPYFIDALQTHIPSLRTMVGLAAQAGIPVPALSSALSYFDGLRTAKLPANLLQAQRDYFGAHMYQRLDAGDEQFFHTDWTGHGGQTASTAYSV